jgi:hypothetical protein
VAKEIIDVYVKALSVRGERSDMERLFDIADKIIGKAYPGEKKGWWGEKRIPNFGILRGAIANALAEKDKEIERLREYILKRGHTEYCGFNWPGKIGKCDCGFEQALREGE